MKLPGKDSSTRHAAENASGRGAFTLIEMMIVLGIVALIMTMALPSFLHEHKKRAMLNAVENVVEACKSARNAAILNGYETEIVFRAEDLSFSVQKVPPPPPDPTPTNAFTTAASPQNLPNGGAVAPEPEEAPEPAVPAFNRQLPDEVGVRLLYVNLQDYMQAPEAHVHFFPNSTSDEFTIVLSGPEGEMQMISLNVVTGAPEVTVISDPKSAQKLSTTKMRKLKM